MWDSIGTWEAPFFMGFAMKFEFVAGFTNIIVMNMSKYISTYILKIIGTPMFLEFHLKFFLFITF